MPHKNIDETIEFQTDAVRKNVQNTNIRRLWKINAMINGVYKLLYLFQTEKTIEMYIIRCRLYFIFEFLQLLFSIVDKKTVYD